VDFRAKPELAKRMLKRINAAQIAVARVVVDSVYADNLDLCTWLEEHQYSSGLAVGHTEVIDVSTPFL
jgi:SRSO17 transposase